MSILLGDSFSSEFLNELSKCKHSISIISPYVSRPAVESLINSLPPKIKRKILITIPPGPEYLLGSVEISALKSLEKHGFQIFFLNNLHAKLYILDEKKVFIGSANFTGQGWNEHKRGNIEDMTGLNLQISELSHIQTRYIKPAQPLDLNGSWVKVIEENKQLIKQHQELTKKLKSFETKIQSFLSPTPRVKEYFSNYHPPQIGYPHIFKYPITKNSGNQAKLEQLDFNFKMGGSRESSHASIKIPFPTISKVLVDKHLKRKTDSWVIHISIDEKGTPYLRSFIEKTGKEEKWKLDTSTLLGELKTVKINLV